MKGLAGADCARPVDQRLIDFAEGVLGQVPAFWCRYFKGPRNSDPVQYQSHRESTVLHANDIRVLPIARQTVRVGLSRGAGRADGGQNVRAIAEAFGADYLAHRGAQFFVFLDVEESHPSARSIGLAGQRPSSMKVGERRAGGSSSFRQSMGPEMPP